MVGYNNYVMHIFAYIWGDAHNHVLYCKKAKQIKSSKSGAVPEIHRQIFFYRNCVTRQGIKCIY